MSDGSLDMVIARMQKLVERKLASGSPFSLQFEQFSINGHKSWRALLKLGNPVWATSKNYHTSPTGALLELLGILEDRHGHKIEPRMDWSSGAA